MRFSFAFSISIFGQVTVYGAQIIENSDKTMSNTSRLRQSIYDPGYLSDS
jgi:hypothetical protein